MARNKYNLINAELDMRFQSFEILPMGKELKGELFELPGMKVLIISCEAEIITRDNEMIYSYRAKVMK